VEKRDLDITIILIIAGSMCALGIFIGFGVTTYFYNQLQALIGFGALFALLTWLGRPTEVLGFITKYVNERRNKPKLEVEYDVKGNPAQHIAYTTHEVTGYGKVKKKVLRIQVFNRSEGEARCKARLLLIENDKKTYPKHDLKFLRWSQRDIPDNTMPIGAWGDEALNVIFSTEKSFHGMNTFVAKPASINEPNVPIQDDGFEIGSHIFEVRIDPEKGRNFSFRFRVEVSKNWEKISMVKIR
jgi:hypothetical protein